MKRTLRDAVVDGDHEAIDSLFSSPGGAGRMPLVSLVDELLPLSLMQCNLRYGSFHAQKQQLFCRRLAVEGCLSPETQASVGRLLSHEMARTRFIPVETDFPRHPAAGEIDSAVHGMLAALDEGNAHNAFYYAAAAPPAAAGDLIGALLARGARSIPDTLGHSASCFFPSMEDLVSTGSVQAPRALFSYIVYLCRYPSPRPLPEGEEGDERSALLRRCASGGGIENLHHMITFSVLTMWERSGHVPDGIRPMKVVEAWTTGKDVDGERRTRAQQARTAPIPSSYDDFRSAFSLGDTEESMPLVYSLLEARPRDAVDWIFRAYASRYEGEWNPHYYTSLYCALSLFKDGRLEREACRMALEQAIAFFARSMGDGAATG